MRQQGLFCPKDKRRSAPFTLIKPSPRNKFRGEGCVTSVDKTNRSGLNPPLFHLGSLPLVENFVEHDACGDGEVERVAAADHWNANHAVAQALHLLR